MFNPTLHTLLVQAHAEERQRAAQIYNRGRGGNYPPAAPLSSLIKRAINSVFTSVAGVHDDAAPVHRVELLSRSSAAAVRPRS